MTVRKNVNQQLNNRSVRSSVKQGLQKFTKDDRGMSTVEYVILLVVIVVGAVGIWNNIGDKVKGGLTAAETSINKLKTK